jgi:hypothetical protein
MIHFQSICPKVAPVLESHNRTDPGDARFEDSIFMQLGPMNMEMECDALKRSTHVY